MSLASFLKTNYFKKSSGNVATHSRIANKDQQIQGGSYYIPKDLLNAFHKLYYDSVIVGGKEEYLTEKQLNSNGPILIDFDFKYKPTVIERVHGKDHIVDIIDLYLEKLKLLFEFDDKPFPIYVFEKVNVNTQTEVTKDGIHIIIGIQCSNTIQLMLREMVLEDIGEASEPQLPLINSWSNVLDEGISVGHTNWQLYGSCKPGHDKYNLTYDMTITFGKDDAEFTMVFENIPQRITFQKFQKLCAQCETHSIFKLTKLAEDNAQKVNQTKEKKTRTTTLKILAKAQPIDFIKPEQIKTASHLDAVVEGLLSNLKDTEYLIKETHEYTMTLPESYYGDGSRDKWIRVGWALRNLDHRMFITWMKFSSQSKNFNYSDIPGYYEQWENFEEFGGFTNKSIMFWSRQDSDSCEYDKVHTDTIDYYVEASLKDKNDFDIANVLFQIYKDRFICVNVKNNIWYEFKEHRWFEIDSGTTLRLAISVKLFQEYQTRLEKYLQSTDEIDDNSKGKAYANICSKCKKTNDKNNIMREARELFFDKSFILKEDNNPLLMCFKNGVYDFSNKIFRDGRPEDYMTKSTNINYLSESLWQTEILTEINNFMKQLFPDDSLRTYMWDHLASTLVGTNENQTFNIYTGSGRNGKSKLVELMSMVLGEYKATVPITLVTQKRNTIGGTSSEVVQLKGIRYAVMQEPSKGDSLNEGIMKEITGGDPLQGRALFKESVTFKPQFKLVVCTNTLFDIKSNDDGTWRRIRICDFMSKFNENPVYDDPDEPHQFLVDKKLDSRFDSWKETFMSILVKRLFSTNGVVADCDIVMCKSNDYRDGLDIFAEFIKDKINVKEDGIIKHTELRSEFRDWFKITQNTKIIPNNRELTAYFDKKFGKSKKNGKNNFWEGITIAYDESDIFENT